jgi:hypothetical protein
VQAHSRSMPITLECFTVLDSLRLVFLAVVVIIIIQTQKLLLRLSNSIAPIVEASAIQVDESGALSLVAAKRIAVQTAATCGMSESH